MKSPRWDVFCRVIDNFGDIGVCWRLCAQLAARGRRVRLRVDDASALLWMAPSGSQGVEVLDFDEPWSQDDVPEVVIEAFGCEAPAPYLKMLATCVERQRTSGKKTSILINLEYLSAEPYVERCHRLPSPIGHGVGAGLTRWFFYPGFTLATGGLIRERGLTQWQANFNAAHWRHENGLQGIDCTAISLFCYEPPGLKALLAQVGDNLGSKRLFLHSGRGAKAVEMALQDVEFSKQYPHLQQQITIMPLMPQTQFDAVLRACDLNFVRGEDSLVQALMAGKPLIWNIYPQDDGAHWAKLAAFLNWMDAPESLRRWHAVFNGAPDAASPPTINAATLAQWGECVSAARARVCQQRDLIENLDIFVAEKS